MKIKTLLLPIALLALVACGGDTSSSIASVGVSQGTTQSTPVSTTTSTTPSISLEEGVGVALPVTGTFASVIPEGWVFENSTYAPEFYAAPAEGLKIRFEGVSVTSPKFVAANAVAVKLNIAALNANTKTVSASTDVFTAYGYNASGAQVATAGITAVTVSANNTINLTGTGIVKVKITMTGYQMSGGFGANVSLASVTIS